MKLLRRALIPTVVAASTLLLSTPTASAHHQEWTTLPTVYTLGEGHSVACIGQITGTVQTPHDRPGIALVTLSWTPFFTSPCSVTANVRFSLYGTHRGGTMPVHLTNESNGLGAPHGNWTRQVAVPTGSGEVGLTVATDTLNSFYLDSIAMTTRVVVP